MTRVVRDIPFRDDFREALLSGRKTATTRMAAYGSAGDEFTAFGSRFLLESVERVDLGHVGRHYWREEGCQSHEEFVRIWKEIHPRSGFRPEESVYLHRFHLLMGGA